MEIICLIVLRFYDPVNTIKVMLSQLVNLSTLLLSRLPKQLTNTIKVPIFLPRISDRERILAPEIIS